MTTLRKALIIATITVLAGAGIYEGRQTSRLRNQVETLLLLQAPLVEQIAALKTENQRLSNQVASMEDAHALTQAQRSELLKLRGRVASMAPVDARELAGLKSMLAGQNGRLPDYLTNMLAMELSRDQKSQRKSAMAPVARMKEMLHLTGDQELAVSNAAMGRVERLYQIEIDGILRHLTPEQLAEAASVHDQEESELKAMLTPEQLAAYPEYLQEEKNLAANDSAQSRASRLAEELKMSGEQQEKLRAKLYELNLKEPPDPLDTWAIIKAGRTGGTAGAIPQAIELRKSQLEEKLRILGEILTSEQLNAYREDQIERIEMGAFEAMLFLIPQQPAGTTN